MTARGANERQVLNRGEASPPRILDLYAQVVRGAARPEAAAVARLLVEDLLRRGLLPDEVDGYRRTQTWFPWLRGRPELAALGDAVVDAIPALDGRDRCEPQVVVQPPDGYRGPLDPHVDEPPPWADRPYFAIVGAAISPQTVDNGGLVLYPPEGGPEAAPELSPGDLLLLDPTLPHASGGNLTAWPRVAVYLRFLA